MQTHCNWVVSGMAACKLELTESGLSAIGPASDVRCQPVRTAGIAPLGGPLWSLWFGMGTIAYLAGMANIFGWLAFLGAIPLALAVGFILILIAGRHTQITALIGPILASLWFMM